MTKKYNKESFEKHLKEEHRKSALSTYLKEIVYGGSDGIVTTFAVVAGFSGAQQSGIIGNSYFIVLLFGLANLFADATSMGLGNFLSIRADKDQYKKEKERERLEIGKNFSMEMAETVFLLESRGFTKEQAKELAKTYSQNKEYWLEFMMKYEHEMQNPEDENPIFTGLATFLAFVFFGFIPLVPYIFLGASTNLFSLSISFTFLALVMLGILRWRVVGDNLLRSLFEIILLGGISAIVAYLVGMFFSL